MDENRNDTIFGLVLNKRVIIALSVFVAVIAFGILLYFIFRSSGGETKNGGKEPPIDNTKCGIRYGVNARMFITNGSEPSLGFAPWFVSIVVRNITLYDGTFIDKYMHACGGSIISQKWVLTATHCLTDLGHEPYDSCIKYCRVIAGSQKHNDTGYSYGTRHRIVKQIPFDKDYDSDNSNDIALLEVDPPFQYRAPGTDGHRAIGAVCLPEKDEKIIEPEGDIVGFGTTNDTLYQSVTNGTVTPNVTLNELYSLPENLFATRVKIINRDECIKIPVEIIHEDLRETNWTTNLKENATFCAGNLKNRQFGCWFDSGGPLTVFQNKKITQIGITSMHLTGTCLVDPVWYTIYTSVYHYRNWIRNTFEILKPDMNNIWVLLIMGVGLALFVVASIGYCVIRKKRKQTSSNSQQSENSFNKEQTVKTRTSQMSTSPLDKNKENTVQEKRTPSQISTVSQNIQPNASKQYPRSEIDIKMRSVFDNFSFKKGKQTPKMDTKAKKKKQKGSGRIPTAAELVNPNKVVVSLKDKIPSDEEVDVPNSAVLYAPPSNVYRK